MMLEVYNVWNKGICVGWTFLSEVVELVSISMDELHNSNK